jgi:TRAP-type C4-dicarboxylate transport system permease small subunit
MEKKHGQSALSTFGILLDTVALAGFLGVVVLVFLQVLFRYLFKLSVPWTEELARLLFCWVTFLGAALAIREDEHIYVDIFFKKLPPKAALLIIQVYDIIILIFFIFLLRGFYQYMIKVRHSYLVALKISYFYVYLGALISYGVLVFYLLLRMAGRIAALQPRRRAQ